MSAETAEYELRTVVCGTCSKKQDLHVTPGKQGIQIMDQDVKCLYCGSIFPVRTNAVMAGPFPFEPGIPRC